MSAVVPTADNPGIEQILLEIWTRRAAWSRVADRFNRRISRGRIAALALSGLGAVLAALAATAGESWTGLRGLSAGASAACLAASTFVAAEFVSTDLVRQWTRARALSEAIKSEVFIFRAAAAPYDGFDAAVILQRKIRALESPMHDMEHLRAKAGTAAATLPPVLDTEGYIEVRVRGQIDRYYRPKIELYMRRLSLLRSGQTTLNLTAALMGGIAAYMSGKQGGGHAGFAAWVAIFTTLATSLSAHQAAARYEFLVTSFCATAARLEELIEVWRLADPSEQGAWSHFVRDCEAAIATENGGWMSKWAGAALQK